MTGKLERIWLVYNESSGSNDDESLSALEAEFDSCGCEVRGQTCFPDQNPPDRAALEREDIQILAIFGGDGTISSITTSLYGWGGAILPLPGGTMNMLSRRMHGDAEAPEIVARLRNGIVRKVRPSIIRSRHGDGLTGVLAGPGTVWNEVREAMRSIDLVDLVSSTTEAISWTANGPKVACLNAECGRDEGYAAITVAPAEKGLQANGYYADTIGDYAKQGVALLQHDFRNGPHDDLGQHPKLRLATLKGEPMGLLIDGEPFDGEPHEDFELVPSEVDIVTTADAR